MKLEDITACGECCTDCAKKTQGLCSGCIAADGRVPEWAQSGRCRVHACARDHGVQFCGICPDFPCGRLSEMIPWNKNIAEHLRELADTFKQE